MTPKKTEVVEASRKKNLMIKNTVEVCARGRAGRGRKSLLLGNAVRMIILLLSACAVWAKPDTPQRPLPDKDGNYVPISPYVYDPVTRDLGDPTILFNRDTGKAWVFYTQRPRLKAEGTGWYHGGDIGVLSSAFGGFSWLYRGTAEGLGAYAPGRNGFWAPEVIYHEGLYHMYVTFVPAVPLYSGPAAHRYNYDPEDIQASGTLHYTSKDLLRWTFVSRLPLEPDNGHVIDPVVHPLPDGTWRMWYRARLGKQGEIKPVTCYADSKDLNEWTCKGIALDYDCYAEAVHVFHFKGWYWMFLDGMSAKYTGEKRGMAVWRSKDALKWELQEGGFLREKSTRPRDDRPGHGSVVIQGGRAFMLYQAFSGGTCAGHLAELLVKDGVLVGTREIRPMRLDGAKAPQFRGGKAPNFEE